MTTFLVVMYFVVALAAAAYTGYKLFTTAMATGWKFAFSKQALLETLGTSLQALMIGIFWPATGTLSASRNSSPTAKRNK